MVKSPFNVEIPHVEVHYDAITGKWSQPVVQTESTARIHPLATAISFGQQCFEGLKAFKGPDGKFRIFRPIAHGNRLNHSARYVSMPSVPGDVFMEAVRLAVTHNSHMIPDSVSDKLALYIRPFLMGTSPQFVPIPSDEYTLYVFVAPLGMYLGEKPLDVLVEEMFDHAAPRGVGSAKLGSNYGPLMQYDDAAKRQGFHTTLHTDALTHSEIEEFATSGFIGIRRSDAKTTVVVPNSTCIIDSITTDSVVQIARHFGWNVEKRVIQFDELETFDEVVAAGTAASLCAVRRIVKQSTGQEFVYLKDQALGDAAAQIKALLSGIQRGQVDDVFGWMIDVNAVKSPFEDEANMWLSSSQSQ